MANIITELTARIEDYRSTNKNPCKKCGAINGGKSKHRWTFVQGKKCCGHCGAVAKRTTVVI